MNITIKTPINPTTELTQEFCRIIEVTKDRGVEGIFSTKILVGLQHRNGAPTINIPTNSKYIREASIVLGVDFMLTKFMILKNRFGPNGGYYPNVYRAVTRVSNYIGEDFRLNSYEEHQLILMINRAISEITDMAIFFTRDGYFMSKREWYINGYQKLTPSRYLKKMNFSKIAY